MAIFKLDRLQTATALAIIVLSLGLLWMPPIIGVADNGDFHRMLYWGKFEPPALPFEDLYFGWINREYRITRHPLRAWYGFPSSDAIFIKASAILALLWPGGGKFDLRLLGLTHVLGFAAAAVLLLGGWRAGPRLSPYLLIAGLLFFFCDSSYLVYFQSFYSESATFIFFFALLGACLHLAGERISVRHLAIFFGSALFFITAKPQNLPLILPLALFAADLYRRARERAERRTIIIGMSIIVIIAASVYLVIPPNMKKANLYNTVFNGVLRWVPSQTEALRDLGLDEGMKQLTATSYFATPVDVESAEFQSAFYARTSLLKVGFYYLLHPSVFLRALKVSSLRGYDVKRNNIGNFEKSAGYPRDQTATRWSLWSRFKRQVGLRPLWATAGYLTLLLVGIAAIWRKGERNFAFLYLVLWMMMIISFVTPVMADGESDLEKHLFLYNVFFDLSLLFAAAYLVKAVGPRLDARRRA
jgi:hypothetical protein